jgi:uncharacterized membrane protein
MAKPMFFYVGVYDSETDAEADDDAIKELDNSGAIGSYDSAILVKEADGKVRVTKTEKPVEHGAWIGAAAGAGAAIVFPFLLPGLLVAGAAGAGLGAWFAHLAHGTSREDARKVGELLKDGDAAVVVIGIDKDADQIAAVASHARERVLKRSVGDWDAAEDDALEALKQAEAVPA